MRLITNNPLKRRGLEGYGLTVVENVQIVIPANKYNKFYLETKVRKMGHVFGVDKIENGETEQ
jgi:3,4-dihydroxy 2-butanone 4-phosphate synthase/GTP cyclohydrolase II